MGTVSRASFNHDDDVVNNHDDDVVNNHDDDVVNNHVNATHLNLAEEVIFAQSRIGFPVWSY